MMIDTILGPLPAADLIVSVTKQLIPVGELRTTTYRLGEHLVRQDQHIQVHQDKLPTLGSQVGRFS